MRFGSVVTTGGRGTIPATIPTLRLVPVTWIRSIASTAAGQSGSDVKCREYWSCKSFVSTYWDTWYDSFDKAKTADPNDQDDRGANPFYDDYPDDPNDPFYAGPAEDRRWARYSAWDDYVGTDERLR